MGIANSADYSQIWSEPAGSPAKTNDSLTAAILGKLGSGLSAGIGSAGAGIVGSIGSSLAGLNPAMMGVQAVGQIAQAAMGGPTNQTGESGKLGGMKVGGGDFVVNYSGKLSNSHTNPDSFGGTGDAPAAAGGGGPNYIFWAVAGLVGLVAIKMVTR